MMGRRGRWGHGIVSPRHRLRQVRRVTRWWGVVGIVGRVLDVLLRQRNVGRAALVIPRRRGLSRILGIHGLRNTTRSSKLGTLTINVNQNKLAPSVINALHGRT